MNDPYRTIGVSRNADEDEIKRTYRKLVKKYHPDRYQNSSLANEATEKMKEINRAYDAMITYMIKEVKTARMRIHMKMAKSPYISRSGF